jgi:hypothetical protein
LITLDPFHLGKVGFQHDWNMGLPFPPAELSLKTSTKMRRHLLLQGTELLLRDSGTDREIYHSPRHKRSCQLDRARERPLKIQPHHQLGDDIWKKYDSLLQDSGNTLEK